MFYTELSLISYKMYELLHGETGASIAKMTRPGTDKPLSRIAQALGADVSASGFMLRDARTTASAYVTKLGYGVFEGLK